MSTSLSMFRPVPMTGVIFVTTEATKRGFYPGNPAWSNMGQGAPDTESIHEDHHGITPTSVSNEYGPVAGVWELREAVAHLYNDMYRKGKLSLYTAENVAIAGGGRLALARIAAALGNINVGHFIPDYTAYEELLTVFRAFTPIPIPLDEKDCYALRQDSIARNIQQYGLGAILFSNPSNPTGRVCRGADLAGVVAAARANSCALIADEFYSHYLYTDDVSAPAVSVAEFVDDVNEDPVLIVDGLTKSWRKPGWRISWTVAPTSVIRAIESVGSFLDGGASHVMQRAAIPFVDPARVAEDAPKLRRVFSEKRAYVLDRLTRMGLSVPCPPEGSFYVWACLERLPEPLQDGMRFFEAALDERVIVVPGEFFDVNPDQRRRTRTYKNYIRVSFGPSLESLRLGCDGLERTIKKYSET